MCKKDLNNIEITLISLKNIKKKGMPHMDFFILFICGSITDRSVICSRYINAEDNITPIR